MKVFDHSDYRAFIRARLDAMPKKGHGQYKKMAEFLKLQSSMISQIMSGQKDLSPELGSLLCDYFGLSELESDYCCL